MKNILIIRDNQEIVRREKITDISITGSKLLVKNQQIPGPDSLHPQILKEVSGDTECIGDNLPKIQEFWIVRGNTAWKKALWLNAFMPTKLSTRASCICLQLASYPCYCLLSTLSSYPTVWLPLLAQSILYKQYVLKK